MRRHGGSWCSLALLVLLPVAGGRGPPKCQEQAVPVNGALQLLLENPPQEWEKLIWKLSLSPGHHLRILTAEKNKDAQYPKGPFFRRSVFQEEPLSLWVSPVSPADRGVYQVEFENSSGVLTTLCFHVSVWEPVQQLHLETRILHQEQGWCNFSLVCTVPGASNISYNWSCSGGAQEDQPQLHLEVHGDADPTICHCNASNPVSWSRANTSVTCPEVATGPFSTELWWAVAVCLGLALVVSLALVTCCWWKRRKDSPGEDSEQTLTVYAEVNKAQTGRDANVTSEATGAGNTIYAVISSRTQGPRCPQDPESCTIYSTIQPTRKSPSIKRKRLDPALVSTAYLEATESFRSSCPPLRALPPAP